jgi:hypothetical protein
MEPARASIVRATMERNIVLDEGRSTDMTRSVDTECQTHESRGLDEGKRRRMVTGRWRSEHLKLLQPTFIPLTSALNISSPSPAPCSMPSCTRSSGGDMHRGGAFGRGLKQSQYGCSVDTNTTRVAEEGTRSVRKRQAPIHKRLQLAFRSVIRALSPA